MFILIQHPAEVTLLNLIRGAILPVSFFLLALFGTKVIVDTKKGHPALHALPLILFMIWAAVVSVSSRKLIGETAQFFKHYTQGPDAALHGDLRQAAAG